ncbi:MAG: carboxypeptidase regulatory-like domain-containing protein [Bacteroidota bacterium]|nr:carboxypeptidase regulatory-like domain-containing protein [Bacteroidota bacterium]
MKIFRCLVLPLLLFLFLVSCSEDNANQPATVSVSGTVQVAGSAAGLPGADVIASRHDNSEVLGRTVTDSTGAFLLQGLPPVLMDIVVEANGYAPVLFESMDPVASPQALGNMSVQMTALDTCCSGVLILYVKNAAGEKLKNIPVVIKKNGVVIDDPRTNENGRIAVDGLCPGDYSIRIAAEPYKVYEAVFTINAGCEPVELIAQLQQESEGCCQGVLTLIVRDGSNNPVVGAKVLVRRGAQVVEDPRTDANGKIIVDGLCAGEYNYRVSKEGYKVVEGVFAIDSNCTPVTKEATLEQVAEVCCSGVLTVTVVDSSATAMPGATVKLWKSGALIETAQTNAQGIAVFDGLCKGEYGVAVLKEGLRSREFTFAVNENCDPFSKTMELLP